jgi:hypothetical protein
VKQLGTGESILRLDLGSKVPENDDGRRVGTDEDGADEELEVL